MKQKITDNTITESLLIKKRRPILSIIISADNDVKNLANCLNSFNLLKKDTRNIEFIIINNYCEEESRMTQIRYLLKKYDDYNLFFYQSTYRLSLGQSRNLGIDFSKGTWLYFVEDTERATSKFSHFLGEFKFDLQIGFYRVPLLNEQNKKLKIGWPKTKYFSTKASSIILNEEFMDLQNIRWDSSLKADETLLFLDKIYSIKNVNFVYLKKHFAVVHNFSNDNSSQIMNDIDNVEKTYHALLRQHKINYKQFIIVLFYNYLSRNASLKKEERQKIKKALKKAKIGFWSYLPLGPKMFFKTLKMRWKFLF